MSQDDVFYQALIARDPRFDGKFFVGVKTTGIYCRPICPAKPKRKNVEFFASAVLAETAGYRPCLRCRPEVAPLSPAWHGTSAVLQRALKLIAAHHLHGLSEETFAAQLGMSARHLRRLFAEEIGQTPKQISDNSRLNFARKLIVESSVPMGQVAESAGFGSSRRFNDAFKKRFSKSPRELRRARSREEVGPGLELKLALRPPYDWHSILQFFSSHQIPGVEEVNEFYSRIFKLDGEIGYLEVHPGTAELRLKIVLENPKALFKVVHRVRRMFDLDSDPLLIAEVFSGTRVLSELHAQYPGLRMPQAWDPFEAAVCTILGQLLSVEQARRLAGQLVENYGEEGLHPISGGKIRLFPTPQILAKSDLSKVKTTAVRKAAIRELSRKLLKGEISFSEAQDPAAFRKSLLNIKGIGPWSAEYISLRGIGDADAFPGTDLILRRFTELHPHVNIEGTKPWRSYAAIYIWKGFAKSLSKKKEKKNEPLL